MSTDVFARRVLALFTDPKAFGRWFAGDSWRAWLAVLYGLFGIAPDDPSLADLLLRLTQRTSLPLTVAKMAVFVVGRGAGKSVIAAFLGCCFSLRDYSAYLMPGERAVVALYARDRKQAQILLRYIKGFFDALPMLRALVERETANGLDLTNSVTIEVHTATFRGSPRGLRIVCAICDEIAFWSIDGANPDREILTALGPALARTPGSLLILLSSPFSRKGELWRMFKQHFGNDGDVLVVNADTRSMNVTFDVREIERAFEDDAVAAASEYGSDGRVEFRKDIEQFIGLELLERAIVPGRGDLPYAGMRCKAFFDGSGGTTAGGDSATLAIGHREGETLVVDLIREVKPPYDPETVVAMFATECRRRYRVTEVVGDQFAGSWPQAAFRKHGVEYRKAKLVKTDLYREAMPLFSSGRVELPDNVRLKKQLLGLERTITAGGREKVDHENRKGAHDDVANAVCGVLQELSDRNAQPTVAVILPRSSSGTSDDSWRDAYFGIRRSDRSGGLLPAPQRSEPSAALLALREENARADRAEELRQRELAEHVRQLAAQHEIKRLRPAVEQYGTDTVEKVLHRRLAAELRGVTPQTEEMT